MKRSALMVSMFLVVSLAFSQSGDDVGREMVEGAEQFLSSLSAENRAMARIDFDDEERYNFHYIPRDRKGVPLKIMTGGERKMAHALMARGLSAPGMSKALGIMYLDQILYEIEKRDIRDPDKYYFTIFGEPSSGSTWGWRVEGHHLSLNFTVENGRVASTTPSFFGTNPAIVPEGPHEGLQVLATEEIWGRELFHALDASQREKTLIQAEAPRDIVTTTDRRVSLGEPRGLSYSDMTAEQQTKLMALVEDYAHRKRRELADEQLERIRSAGIEGIHFAWAGGGEPGEPHYYRIHGPTFLIEYDNTQNDANHIHTVWRDLDEDWGESVATSNDDDLLARHYRESPHHRHGF